MQLQPLDVCINKRLQERVRSEYEEWLAENNKELTLIGHIKQVSSRAVGSKRVGGYAMLNCSARVPRVLPLATSMVPRTTLCSRTVTRS